VNDRDIVRLKLALSALVMLVRDEWPSDYSLEEIVAVTRCSSEQLEAIRALEAGELPIRVSD
jgi:hypothetical protein